MKVAIIGASGYVGSAVLNEALARGHNVTALVTNPARVPERDQLVVLRADVLDQEGLARNLAGHDAVITAFSGHAQGDVRAYYMRGMRSIVGAVKAANVSRLLVVGGAGSLEIAPGVQLIDSPHFPAQWKATAEGARDALYMLQGETQLNWTVLAPSAHLESGQRTGSFRRGSDALLSDADGVSHISLEDYALAMVDELERPAYPRARFTVGY